MPNYQDFLRMARERNAKVGTSKGSVSFTRHAEYKMKQYGLSPQRVRSVMRNPKRREEGIAKNTVAVMQPSSVKRKDGKETWNQEIWVMFTLVTSHKSKVEIQKSKVNSRNAGKEGEETVSFQNGCVRVISAWRYPGVSPQRNPVPAEILRELEEGSILEEEGVI